MGIIIFWSVLALFYLVLAICTSKALCGLKQALRKLDNISPSGIYDTGRVIPIESILYKFLKAILITDICGFILAAVAAIFSIFTTYSVF
jgi:hypothetical protein